MHMIRTASVAAALGVIAGLAPLHAQQASGGNDHHQDRQNGRWQSEVPAPAARPQPQARPQLQPEPQPRPRAPEVRVQPEPRPEPQPQPARRPDYRPVPAPVTQPTPPVEHRRWQDQAGAVPEARQPERQPERLRQEQQWEEYRQNLGDYARRIDERSALLQQQRRVAQYRVQQQYLAALRAQDLRLRHRHAYDDGYYDAPFLYRYYHGGSYYETSRYGADVLQRALNYGYDEGVRAGQADQQDGWPFDYQDSYAYQDANYGYEGWYVSQADYNYYFRQGFRRGYEDGYSGRLQYGTYYDGNYSMLDAFISRILGLQLIP